MSSCFFPFDFFLSAARLRKTRNKQQERTHSSLVAASSRATATLSAGSFEQPRCASSSRVTPFITTARGSWLL